MYATIRQYDNISDTTELNRLVQEEFVPLLQGIPGFVSYHWIDVGDVGGRMLSVSIFDSPENAEESNRVAAAWVAAHPNFTPSAYHVEVGPVVAHG